MMEQMEIRLVERQYKSISVSNWARIQKLALPVFGNRNLTPIQSDFGGDTTRGSRQSEWDQFITGTLQ
jgi:hypothetical protein